MNRSVTPLFSLALALSVSMATALAQGGPGGAPGTQGGPGGSQPDPTGIYRDAGASPEQLQKIREMAREYEQAALVKAERIKNLIKKMQELSLQPNPDEKNVLATQDEINTLTSEMAIARLKVMLKIRVMLSEDQRLCLVNLMKQRMAANSQGAPGQ